MNSSARPCSNLRYCCLAMGFWGPIVLLLCGSYAYLAVLHGRWNLFSVVIHENGKYTLGETIFYFRHFIREIPPTMLIALAAVAAFTLHSPALAQVSAHPANLHRAARRFGLGLLLLLAVTLGIAVYQQGGRETLVDLLQFRTRDDRAEYGTHWQYHLLHLLDSILFCLAGAWIVRGVSGHGTPQTSRSGVKLLAATLVLFTLLTLIFSPNLRPFTDSLYLAHQLREIATSRLLLVPVIFGLLYALERRALGVVAQPPLHRKRCLQGLVILLVATLIPIWLWCQLRQVNVLSLAQQQTSLASLYASHIFEHCLDVVFALLLAGWLYMHLILRGTNPTDRAT